MAADSNTDPLAPAVYATVGARDSGAQVTATMGRVIASSDAAQRRVALGELVGELTNGAALSQDLSSVGSPLQRAMLVRELLSEAERATGEDRQRLARAALLLPALDGTTAGIATVHFVLDSAGFGAASGWDATALSKVRELVRAELERRRSTGSGAGSARSVTAAELKERLRATR